MSMNGSQKSVDSGMIKGSTSHGENGPVGKLMKTESLKSSKLGYKGSGKRLSLFNKD
jgi:hypothetical protein